MVLWTDGHKAPLYDNFLVVRRNTGTILTLTRFPILGQLQIEERATSISSVHVYAFARPKDGKLIYRLLLARWYINGNALTIETRKRFPYKQTKSTVVVWALKKTLCMYLCILLDKQRHGRGTCRSKRRQIRLTQDGYVIAYPPMRSLLVTILDHFVILPCTSVPLPVTSLRPR